MNLHPLASACRSCRFYSPEGRRGGNCQQLGVPVRGSWRACSLAMPPFAPSWETLEGIMIWPADESTILHETTLPERASEYARAERSEKKSSVV